MKKIMLALGLVLVLTAAASLAMAAGMDSMGGMPRSGIGMTMGDVDLSNRAQVNYPRGYHPMTRGGMNEQTGTDRQVKKNRSGYTPPRYIGQDFYNAQGYYNSRSFFSTDNTGGNNAPSAE